MYDEVSPRLQFWSPFFEPYVAVSYVDIESIGVLHQWTLYIHTELLHKVQRKDLIVHAGHVVHVLHGQYVVNIVRNYDELDINDEIEGFERVLCRGRSTRYLPSPYPLH